MNNNVLIIGIAEPSVIIDTILTHCDPENLRVHIPATGWSDEVVSALASINITPNKLEEDYQYINCDPQQVIVFISQYTPLLTKVLAESIISERELIVRSPYNKKESSNNPENFWRN